jgi:hypothetical protein
VTTYSVPKCSMRLDCNYRPHYFIDGKEVDEAAYAKMRKAEERENRRKHVKQRKRYRAPANFGDRQDFRRETDRNTGRDGRYYHQLARFHNDPQAVHRTVGTAIEAAKRRGFGVERWA